MKRSVLTEIVGDASQLQLDAARKARRDRCEHDFFLFCRTYFPHYFGSEPAEYHTILMDVVSSGELSQANIDRLKALIKEKYWGYMQPTEHVAGIIDVEPRGFSKTTRFSLAFPIWVTFYKKRHFPILFGSSQRQAQENLEAIKDEIDQNEVLYQDFGNMRGKIWKADKITLANGTAIVARGAGASTRGIKHGPNRPDVAICDDIMTDEIAASKVQRDKRYRWFKRVVLPLGKDILPILINTIFHEDDIVCKLLKELSDGQLKEWVGFRFAARERGEEDAPSMWPSAWPEWKLRKKQEEMGSAAWSTEMMNEPLSSEDAIIKKFHYYEMVEIDHLMPTMKKFGGIDPATGAHDKCAFDTLGDPATGILYVLDTWGERLGEQGFLDRIIATYQLWQHLSIGFEDVAFQGIYKDNLMEKAAQLHVWLPIRGRKTGGLSKVQRVKEMAPAIEAGFVRFRADQKELMEQLSMFTPDGPKSAFDDEADALWYAFKEAQEGRSHGSQAAATTHSIANRVMHSMLQRFNKR